MDPGPVSLDSSSSLDSLSPEQSQLLQALQTRLTACATYAEGANNEDDVQLVVVLADLDIPVLVGLLRRVCQTTPRPLLQAWMANFTKCVLLAGNPQKVAPRLVSLPWSVEGSVAVVGPVAARQVSALRRLLRPLQANTPPEQLCRQIPGDPTSSSAVPSTPGNPELELQIAHAGLSLEQYLVALVHTVAESHLLGELPQEAGLNVRAVGELDVARTWGAQPLYQRVHRAQPPDEGLRLYSVLLK